MKHFARLTEADSGNNEDDFDSVSSLCAKQGKSYPPTIRKLYYSLLTIGKFLLLKWQTL